MSVTKAAAWRPPARSLRLALVCGALALAYVTLALLLLVGGIRANLLALPFAAFFGFVAWSLWRLKRWARWFTLPLLWFAMVIVPLGVLNPFAAADWEGGAPPLHRLLAILAVVVGASLYALHVLGRHKNEFT